MNVELYLSDLERSVANLPDVLASWDGLSPDLREHYSHELLLMLARQAAVLAEARSENSLMSTAFRLVRVNGDLFAQSRAVSSAMGFRPEEVILSGATALAEEPAGVTEAFGDLFSAPLPVAA